MTEPLTYSKSKFRQFVAGCLFWLHLDRLAFWSIDARLYGTPLWRGTHIARLNPTPDDTDATPMAISFKDLSVFREEDEADLTDPNVN